MSFSNLRSDDRSQAGIGCIVYQQIDPTDGSNDPHCFIPVADVKADDLNVG